jgi:hypothetical protein
MRAPDFVEVPENVKDAGQKALRERVRRLGEMMNLNAPTFMLATELDLISRALWLKDPNGMAHHLATQQTLAARTSGGFCTLDFKCEAPVSRDGVCEPHALELDAEAEAIDQEEAEFVGSIIGRKS